MLSIFMLPAFTIRDIRARTDPVGLLVLRSVIDDPDSSSELAVIAKIDAMPSGKGHATPFGSIPHP